MSCGCFPLDTLPWIDDNLLPCNCRTENTVVPAQYLKGLWGNVMAMPETSLSEEQITDKE